MNQFNRISPPGHPSPDPIPRLSLLDLAALPLDELARQAHHRFPARIPTAFVRLMDLDDPDDPLLRQVLPRGEELLDAPGFGLDPLGEGGCFLAPGLLRKYPGRALLLVTSVCAVHCRFCFRRHQPKEEVGSWEGALAVLRRDATVREVILSGGDPLMLGDDRLGGLLDALAAIPALRRVRVHTRIPVAWPERITEGLTRILAGTRLTPVMVVHVNHARELGAEARLGFARVMRAGIPVMSQSVLLKGVNDDLGVLTELFETLADLRVIPYYLHLLDPVAGAAHFHVSDATARALHRALRDVLPGWCVPRLVREKVGEMSKTLV